MQDHRRALPRAEPLEAHMILDALDNWRLYSALPAWERAFGWLQDLTPEAALGEHLIEAGESGRDLYAALFDFDTKNLLDTTLEAHRVYADIHVPLTGPEVHARFALEELTEKTPYDEARDAALYLHPDRFNALFTLHPGQFALYLPHDAHLSQCKTSPAPQNLRKLVIKVRAGLLRP